MEAKKQIKLQAKYRSMAGRGKIVPELRISGLWLEKIGFEIGQIVDIEVSENQLIMKTKAE